MHSRVKYTVMNMRKCIGARLFTVLTAILLLGGCIFVMPHVYSAARAEETAQKTIDLYLIGGQSNAAGYSSKGTLPTETFSNVYYAGQVNKQRKSDASAQNWLEEYKTNVRAGYGKDSGCIGPEYGIAKTINEKYSQAAPAMIFKSAAGGTALRNDSSGENNDFGNWYPRSLWMGEEPNAATAPRGVQYYNFVENFKTVYNTLVADGYTVRVKGMAWMQGCSDLGYEVEYETLLKTFIRDIRADLKTITGDDSLDAMPFVIGEIATTVGYFNNADVPSFNAVQRKAALETASVYSIRTDDLIINGANDQNGTDAWHFNIADAVTLGERFGKALSVAAGIADTDVQLGSFANGELTQAANGALTYKVSEDQRTVTITATPDSGYRLSRFLIDGVDVSSAMQNNSYTTNWRENIAVKATFATISKPSYTFKASFDHTQGRAFLSSEVVLEGKSLYVTVMPDDGYKTKSVTYNETPLRYDAKSDRYVLDSVNGSGTIDVTFEKTGDGDGNAKWVIPVAVIGGILAAGGIAAAITIPIMKKRKSNHEKN